jgi:hypothetical protein
MITCTDEIDKNEEQSRHGECVAPDVSVLLVTYELKKKQPVVATEVPGDVTRRPRGNEDEWMAH